MATGATAHDRALIDDDITFLRRAIAWAAEARAVGGDPFGAVLVRDGAIVREGPDRSVELSDPTAHIELALISETCRSRRLFSLEGYTLYASTEPCPMCAGAIHWARISRVVFSTSQTMLQARTGGRAKPSAAGLIRDADVIGPVLADEGLAVFEGHHFTPKRLRHQRQFGGDNPP